MRLALTTFAALLMGGTAMAADLPSKQAAVNSYAAATTWGGFYIGAHGGGAWATVDPFSVDASGFVYGGHFGYQVQKSSLVAGIELGVTNYANVKPSGSATGCDCIVADVLAKVGFTVTPTVLAYATGGGWWHNANTFGVVPSFGWSAGAGLDWKPLGNNIILGARYLYRDLGGTNTSPIQVTGHELTGRVSLEF